MQVTCHKAARAYVEPSGDRSGLAWLTVEQFERDHAGGDGLPILVDGGCGATFEIPDGRAGWDVNTVIIDGTEMVVERHTAPTCPYCGAKADHLSEPVDPPEQVA